MPQTANKTKSILVSTQKDFVRIPKSYRSMINTLAGEIVFEKWGFQYMASEFLIELAKYLKQFNKIV